MKTIQTLKTEFEAITLMRLFEVEVIDQRTKETDYIIFDIAIKGDTLQAQHEALNKEEEESPKIAFKSVDLDDCFSLVEHLQNLYSECVEAICNGEFYELAD
jgi:hypothetical protein